MAKTQIKSEQIGNQQIKRVNINTSTSGQAVIAKILAGTGISIGSSGVDSGTGDVTVSINNTVTTNSDVQTLSNKSLVDSTTFFIDNADITKKVKLEVGGITTNTTRTITIPDLDFTIAPLASPSFSGTPTAPTASVAVNSNQIATTAYVVNQIAASTTLPVWGSITGTLSNQTDLQSELNLKANLASPTFTGIPLAPTAASNTNTTQLATTAFVQTAISNLINAAPTQLDTLNELAAALGNDANFATTITSQLATKQPVGNYITALTGDVTATGPNSVAATVTRIQGRNIASAAPTDQQALRWNNALSQWEPQTIIGMGINNQITGATAGSVLFAGASGVLSQSSNLYFDAALGWLGVGTNNPSGVLHVVTTGNREFRVSSGDNANFNFVKGTSSNFGTISFFTGASRSHYLSSFNDGTFRLTRDSGNGADFVITSAGLLGVNTTSPGAQLHVVASASNVIGQIVKGAVSQSSDLMQWQNSSGVVLAAIKANGQISASRSGEGQIEVINPSASSDGTWSHAIGGGGQFGHGEYAIGVGTSPAALSYSLKLYSYGVVDARVAFSAPDYRSNLTGAGPVSIVKWTNTGTYFDGYLEVGGTNGNIGSVARSIRNIIGTWGTSQWDVRDLSNNVFLTVLKSGNVGIGTSSPVSLFSVGANSEFQVRSNGSIKPASMTDASAANDSIYYSTTQNKLCYKDSSGVSNPLY